MNEKINYTVKEVKNINLNPKDYLLYGSRKTCLVRDEMWIWWFIDHNVKSFVDLPYSEGYNYCVDKNSAMRFFERYAIYLQKNWQQHLKKYKHMKKELAVVVLNLIKGIKTNN